MGIPCSAGVVDDGTQEGSQVGQAAGPDHTSVGCSWDTSVQRCVAGRETSRHPRGFHSGKDDVEASATGYRRLQLAQKSSSAY